MDWGVLTMMKELAMHILDIAENSIAAGATDVYIEINENPEQNIFSFSITDNGRGMKKEMLKAVRSPFTTSRTTRKVGLGIPMLEQTCISCGGDLSIESEENKGTSLKAVMQFNNIDRPPLGDIESTMQIILCMNADINFIYKHIYNEKSFIIDTKEINEILEGVPLNEPEIMLWMKENIHENLINIYNN